MRPSFKLEVDGSDISAVIGDRLLSIRVNDDAGQKSDTLDIMLDDRDGELPIPSSKAKIKCSLGYEETDLNYMGEFTIDEITLQENPSKMGIRAKASDSSSEFKATKTRSWHDTTIGEIVSTIAGEHGLVPTVHADYQSREVTHIDQENESDAHFLTRMASIYGAVSKPADGRLIFVPEGSGLSASGQALQAATIPAEEILTLRGTVKDRGAYSGVITRFRNKETNLEEEVETKGNDGWFFGAGPMFRDKKLYTSRDMAEQAGQARLRQLQSGTVTIDFTIRGRPDIFAERPISLEGVRAPLAGTWIVKNVTHEYNASGYTTKISAGSGPEAA